MDSIQHSSALAVNMFQSYQFDHRAEVVMPYSVLPRYALPRRWGVYSRPSSPPVNQKLSHTNSLPRKRRSFCTPPPRARYQDHALRLIRYPGIDLHVRNSSGRGAASIASNYGTHGANSFDTLLPRGLRTTLWARSKSARAQYRASSGANKGLSRRHRRCSVFSGPVPKETASECCCCGSRKLRCNACAAPKKATSSHITEQQDVRVETTATFDWSITRKSPDGQHSRDDQQGAQDRQQDGYTGELSKTTEAVVGCDDQQPVERARSEPGKAGLVWRRDTPASTPILDTKDSVSPEGFVAPTMGALTPCDSATVVSVAVQTDGIIVSTLERPRQGGEVSGPNKGATGQILAEGNSTVDGSGVPPELTRVSGSSGGMLLQQDGEDGASRIVAGSGHRQSLLASEKTQAVGNTTAVAEGETVVGTVVGAVSEVVDSTQNESETTARAIVDRKSSMHADVPDPGIVKHPSGDSRTASGILSVDPVVVFSCADADDDDAGRRLVPDRCAENPIAAEFRRKVDDVTRKTQILLLEDAAQEDGRCCSCFAVVYARGVCMCVYVRAYCIFVYHHVLYAPHRIPQNYLFAN